MNRKCRTCLRNVSDLNYVVVDDSARQIRAEIAACIPEISIDLVKNSIMCLICVNTLHMAYDFKIQCLRSDECIRNQINNQNMNEALMPANDIYSVCSSGSIKEEPATSEDEIKSLRLDVVDELNDLLDGVLQVEQELPLPTTHDSTNKNAKSVKANPKTFKDCRKLSSHVVQSKERCAVSEDGSISIPVQDCYVKLLILPKRMIHKRVFLCHSCKYATGNRSHYLEHLVIHSDEKPFTCEICNFATKHRVTMRYHKKQVHRVSLSMKKN